MNDCQDLSQRVLNGDRRAVARAISWVENQNPQAADRLTSDALLVVLYPHTGRAHLIGITGVPGTGKSTLVGQLARLYRQQGVKVGILAIDPTSPFSGGALLGDRLRMQDLSSDPGIFIRSMATRGALGGLSVATCDAAHILDAAGYGVILIETVGVGQDEVEIARLAHTVVVVDAPGLGDDVQAIKAGLTEIADIFVVNKADRPGADQAVHALELMLEMNNRQPDWLPPVCKTMALDGTGVAELFEQIQAHRRHLYASNILSVKEKERACQWLKESLQHALYERFQSHLDPDQWQALVNDIAARKLAPHAALRILL